MGREQLGLINVILSGPSLLFLTALEFMALMRLLTFPLVAFGVCDTFPLVALGPLLICFCHPKSPIFLMLSVSRSPPYPHT